jgi:rsbT antagonist protein RsbS
MTADTESTGRGPRIPLQVSRNCVVASIQIDLSDAILRQLRTDLLGLVASSRSAAVILDLSGVQIIDREDFEGLRQTMSMAAIMGATPVLCGLRPGVVAALVELRADVDGINAAADLDGAFSLVEDLTADQEGPANGGHSEPPAAREADRD